MLFSRDCTQLRKTNYLKNHSFIHSFFHSFFHLSKTANSKLNLFKMSILKSFTLVADKNQFAVYLKNQFTKICNKKVNKHSLLSCNSQYTISHYTDFSRLCFGYFLSRNSGCINTAITKRKSLEPIYPLKRRLHILKYGNGKVSRGTCLLSLLETSLN